MPRSEDLQRIREAIEGVDRDLLALLRRRMDLVEEIVSAKLESGFPFRDPLREEQVLQRVRHAAAETGLDTHQVERLYRLIMEMSLSRQHGHIRNLDTVPLRVAYQGVEGSYSHLTAQRQYAGRKGGVFLTGHESFRAAVETVRQGESDFALLPIENTTAGSINETYDLLAEGGITITAEVVSHVRHCLLGLPGATLETVRTVISHPQALLQCQGFLLEHPGIEARAEFDTAGSARKVREGKDPSMAAIASESAARVYGLVVLAEGIQSESGNFTRFVEVARGGADCPPDSECKTSLLLTLGHQPGMLGKVLGVFSDHRVNLSKIESRPIPGKPFEYRFYLDLLGHAASEEVSAALEAIAGMITEVRVLGTYPRAAEDAGIPRS